MKKEFYWIQPFEFCPFISNIFLWLVHFDKVIQKDSKKLIHHLKFSRDEIQYIFHHVFTFGFFEWVWSQRLNFDPSLVSTQYVLFKSSKRFCKIFSTCYYYFRGCQKMSPFWLDLHTLSWATVFLFGESICPKSNVLWNELN